MNNVTILAQLYR